MIGRDPMPTRREPTCRATSNSTKAASTTTQRRIWDDCKAGPRGSVPPPVHVWLKSPGLADHAHQLGAHVRFGTDFSQKLTEIAILMTARYWTAQFEWAAHVRLALNAGLSQDVIDAIAERKTPRFDDPDEQLVYDFCRDYYEDHRVDDATYERVVKRWGEQGHRRSRRADRLLLLRLGHA